MPATVTTWDEALDHLIDRLTVGTKVVLIDGQSGSGKSTLARLLHQRAIAHGTPAELLHLDHVYPGWTGLRAGAREVAERVVIPVSSGRTGCCLEYNWTTGEKSKPMMFAPGRPLIVEGVGALHPLSAPRASGRVWVTATAVVRRERALARDGDSYRPYWRQWATQEADYVRRTRPRERADLILDTTDGSVI